MGRFPIIQILLGTVLLGGAAFGQQGLIIEPWRRPPSPPGAVASPARHLPASGLPGLGPPATAERRASAPPLLGEPEAARRWSPPVVELLVDPWAKDRLAAPAAPPHFWVPQSVEIIDPWADEPAPPPRVASRRTTRAPAAIF